MKLPPRPGAGPLRPRVSLLGGGEGGFSALEAWLYDSDFVDVSRRRRAFARAAGAARTWRRSVPHSPPGVPVLVRDSGRRRIHVAVARTGAPGDPARAPVVLRRDVSIDAARAH